MSPTKIFTWLCIGGLCFSTLSSSKGNQGGAQIPKESATLSVVQTPEGPQLKIKVGDLICTTPQLTARRNNGEPWTIKPVGGQIEMRRGKDVTAGPIIKVLLRF